MRGPHALGVRYLDTTNHHERRRGISCGRARSKSSNTKLGNQASRPQPVSASCATRSTARRSVDIGLWPARIRRKRDGFPRVRVRRDPLLRGAALPAGRDRVVRPDRRAPEGATPGSKCGSAPRPVATPARRCGDVGGSLQVLRRDPGWDNETSSPGLRTLPAQQMLAQQVGSIAPAPSPEPPASQWIRQKPTGRNGCRAFVAGLQIPERPVGPRVGDLAERSPPPRLPPASHPARRRGG